jgi:hypothetical protein
VLLGDVFVGRVDFVDIDEHHACWPAGLHVCICGGDVYNLAAGDTSDFLFLTALEGPVGWTDAVGGVMNAIVDVEMSIVGLEDDSGGLIELSREVVEVGGARELVNLEAGPD